MRPHSKSIAVSFIKMTGTGSSVLLFTMARTFLSIYMLILFEHNSRTSASKYNDIFLCYTIELTTLLLLSIRVHENDNDKNNNSS